jgi:hypothetical protein
MIRPQTIYKRDDNSGAKSNIRVLGGSFKQSAKY